MPAGATRVLVTGGAGFIGGALVRALSLAGCAVRVMDDFSSGKRERLAGIPAEVLAADVRNALAVRRAMEGAQVVYHLAGVRAPLPGKGDFARAEEVNVGGAIHVLEAAAAVRPRRVVLVSSGAVYGRQEAYVLHEERPALPCTPAAVEQLAVEGWASAYLLARGVPVVTLRLFRVFGPGEPWDGADVPLVPHLCRVALEGGRRRLRGDGRQTRDLVYLDNAVSGLLLAGSARAGDGRVYNIASGESISVAAVWEAIAAAAGIERDGTAVVQESLPPHEPMEMRVSIARARQDFAYAPQILVREGLRRTLVHYRERLRATSGGWFSPPDAPVEDAGARRVVEVAPARRVPPPIPLLRGPHPEAVARPAAPPVRELGDGDGIEEVEPEEAPAPTVAG